MYVFYIDFMYCLSLVSCTVCDWYHVKFVIGFTQCLSLVSCSVCHWLHVVCVIDLCCLFVIGFMWCVKLIYVLMVCHLFQEVYVIGFIIMVFVFGFRGSLSLVWCIVLMLVFRSLRRYICNYKHSWTTLYTEKSTCYTWSWFLHLHESGPMQNQSLEMNVSEKHSFKA